jgi:hypothetical protein
MRSSSVRQEALPIEATKDCVNGFILRAYSVVCLEWVTCTFDVYAFGSQNDAVPPDHSAAFTASFDCCLKSTARLFCLTT